LWVLDSNTYEAKLISGPWTTDKKYNMIVNIAIGFGHVLECRIRFRLLTLTIHA